MEEDSAVPTHNCRITPSYEYFEEWENSNTDAFCSRFGRKLEEDLEERCQSNILLTVTFPDLCFSRGSEIKYVSKCMLHVENFVLGWLLRRWN